MSAAPDRLRPGTPSPSPTRPQRRSRAGPPSRRGRARPQRRGVLRFAVAAVLTLGATVGTLPDLLFGLDRRSPFVQLVSFRPLVLLGVLAVTVLAALVILARRRAWPVAAGLALVSALGATLVVPRALPDGPPPTTGRPLTVLAFNAFTGDADVDAVAALVRAERPDLVALTEAGVDYRSRLAPLIEPMGYRLRSSTGPDRADVGGVTTAAAASMGEVAVRIGDETPFPYVEVTGGALGALRFVAFHAVAPVPGRVPQWRADLRRLEQWCAGPTPAVIAGDLNATLDHSVLRAAIGGCADAADQRGAGLVPTWGPTPRSRTFGPQIDHVLVTHGIAAETFSVVDAPGSDHRALVSRLRLPPRTNGPLGS